jgi:hypothetical protein
MTPHFLKDAMRYVAFAMMAVTFKATGGLRSLHPKAWDAYTHDFIETLQGATSFAVGVGRLVDGRLPTGARRAQKEVERLQQARSELSVSRMEC